MLVNGILYVPCESDSPVSINVVFDESYLEDLSKYRCPESCKTCKYYAPNAANDPILAKFGMCKKPTLKIDFDYGT